MYRSSWFLAAAVLGANMALVQQSVVAKSASEIEAIARAVTVEIRLYRGEKKESKPQGSGVIIDRQGDLYTLVTNRHVICGEEDCNRVSENDEYILSLANEKLRVGKKNIKLVGKDLDLAIIRFRSEQNYAVAKLSAAGSLKVTDKVYTAGFPFAIAGFSFNEGEAIAVANRRLIGDNGYSIIYDAASAKGMSGGAVFNSDGQLVAVHGQGDRYTSSAEIDDNSRVGEKIGYNRGIPVQWLVQNFGELGINLASARSTLDIRATRAEAPSTADEHFISGFNKFVSPKDDVQANKRAAIQEFNLAIQKNSQYVNAYLMRGAIYSELQEFLESLKDYNQAITLNPKLAQAYSNRGLLKTDKLNDAQGALKDYNQAITLDPRFAVAYSNRGLLKTNKLNDAQGALKDYDEAIAINPKLAHAYSNRALLKKDKLSDVQGALRDYNQAIAINPKLAIAYSNRGLLKKDKLNDVQGALKDYNQAIVINPKDYYAYSNRGLLKIVKLKDDQGALRDFNQAIAINPKFAVAYNNRAYLKIKSNDRIGAVKDFQQAAKLFREQGQTRYLQNAIEVLQELGATE
jgi:tetratricopeptide (TPR) repeat protein